MAKFQQIKKIARQGRHELIRGIRKPMPPPSRAFADLDDDDNWRREVDEYQIELQENQPRPNKDI